jgi:hypothetical protein
MKRFWSSNLVTLVNQKSTTSWCIDNFRFCLSKQDVRGIPRYMKISSACNSSICIWLWMILMLKEHQYQDLSLLNALICKDLFFLIDNFRFCLSKQERSNRTFSMNESNDGKKSSIRIWMTILNQPHHFYQTKTTWLWVLILSDNW